MKNRMIIVGMAMLLGASAYADTVWTGGGADNAFTNSANWNNELPTLANPGTMGDANFVFDHTKNEMDNIDLTITGAVTWDSSSGKNDNAVDGAIITMSGSGATMDSDRGLIFGTSTVSVTNSATMDLNRDFILNQDGFAVVDSGGMIRMRKLGMSGNAVFTLGDGTLHIDGNTNTDRFVLGNQSYLNMTSDAGLFKYYGNQVDKVTTAITNGFIRINGVEQTDTSGFSITFDGTNTLVAIPEPATLGLIAAFGGGILFIRHRFMI